MSEREVIQLEPGYLLHHRCYRNTSQMVDCLTARHGVVRLIAQGARRPQSRHRAILQPFVPLTLSWVRRGELGKLIHVESQAQGVALGTQQLMAGFYLNELVLRLLARGDANPAAFSCYSRCLAELATEGNVARPVRLFELRLLEALGYGLNLEHEADSGEPIRAESTYLFELERGLRACSRANGEHELFAGRDLVALREERLDDEASLRAAKRLLQRALSLYLGERPLKTRAVLRDMFDKGLES